MEQILLPLMTGIIVYLVISILLNGDSGAKKLKKRISDLQSVTDINQIHDDVIREKNVIKDKKAKTLISKKFEDELASSGIKLSAREYLGAWIGTTFIPVLLLILSGKSIVTIIGAGIIGFLIPPILVNRAKKKRQQLFNVQLSETLVVMGNCIKSGYSFQQAMDSIANEMRPPIANEFTYALREMRYGVKLEDALEHMVDRTRNPDLGLLVSAVVTSSQVGANLTDILDNIAATINDRIKIKNEVRILTAQGRISGIIISLLPVIIALLLMLINPNFIITFFQSLLGRIMIVIGLILEVIGYLIIRKVVNIKY